MRVLICSFLIILLHYSNQERDCTMPDYFWRPYRGHIPPDAFPVSKDKKLRPLYIGMRITSLLNEVEMELVTCPVFSDSVGRDWLDIPYEHLDEDGKYMSEYVYINILCADPNSTLAWVNIKTDPDEITDKCCLVEGGVKDVKGKMYTSVVGRYQKCQTLLVGYRYREKSWKGLHTVLGNIMNIIPDYYQLLTYNCDAKCLPHDEL